jgi:uncharacterized hydrophobic protein (TIGR00271 family)
MFRMRPLEPKQRHEIGQRVRDDAVWSYRYIMLLSVSAIIASFGLLANSPAVVIGAMIIAPLMGPILGLSLGMVRGSPSLSRSSLIAEGIGVVAVVLIAFLVGLLPFTLGVSDEMLARTAPTTFDIAIALASGIAAAYASVNRKVSSTLAGVAISVALVPPLASGGLMFAFGRPDLGFGALLLWAANFLSIQLAAAAVYAFYGFVRREEAAADEGRWRLFLRFSPSLVALGLVGWFLTATLLSLFENHTIEVKVRDVLATEIAKRTGGRLDDILKLERINGGWTIVASALTPQPFDSAQVRQIEFALRDGGVPNASLIVRSLVSQDVSAVGRVYLTQTEVRRQQEAARQATDLEEIREALKIALDGHEGVELTDVELRQENEDVVVTAVAMAPNAITPAEVERAQAELIQSTEGSVRLVVRSITTRDASSTGFLFQPQDEAPDAELDRLRDRLQPIIGRRLTSFVGAATPGRGVTLKGFSLTKKEALIEVAASVESPAPMPAQAVREIEVDLRRNVDHRLRLSVATNLVAGG